jgi:hypothetical protein
VGAPRRTVNRMGTVVAVVQATDPARVWREPARSDGAFVGRYSRPDVFQPRVDTTARRAVTFESSM